jgi:hypothetical protein
VLRDHGEAIMATGRVVGHKGNVRIGLNQQLAGGGRDIVIDTDGLRDLPLRTRLLHRVE